jgi:hypothetical protein
MPANHRSNKPIEFSTDLEGENISNLICIINIQSEVSQHFKKRRTFRNAFGLSNTYIVKYKSGNEVQLYLRDYEY